MWRCIGVTWLQRFVACRRIGSYSVTGFGQYMLVRHVIIIIIIYITSIALKSSGALAQKRNKTKSLFIFKSRGHTGVIINLRGR